MQSTGGRLRGQGKTKQGNLWEWIQSKTERHIYIGGSGIVNIYYTHRLYLGQNNSGGSGVPCSVVCPEGSGQRVTDIPKACYLRCKRQRAGSVTVEIGLCQGTTVGGHDYPPWSAFS